MSKPIGTCGCAAIGLGLLLPVVIAIVVLETLGVAEYALPIMLPIFFTMLVVLGLLGSTILYVSRISQKSQSLMTDGLITSADQQIADGSSSVYVRRQGGHFMIPMYCPHCGNGIDLQRVDWSSSRAFTCPTCYHEIDVKTV